jgi:hypothetical protein
MFTKNKLCQISEVMVIDITLRKHWLAEVAVASVGVVSTGEWNDPNVEYNVSLWKIVCSHEAFKYEGIHLSAGPCQKAQKKIRS